MNGVYPIQHRTNEAAGMREATITVDDETYRHACARALELDTSVSALVLGFLRRLAPDAGRRARRESHFLESVLERRRRLFDEIFADFTARGVGLRMADNLSREELYEQNNQTGGVFNFGNRATGVGLAELLLGHVGSASINDADILDRRTDYFGFFVQDDWRATSKLTLNIGMRYEFDTPLWDKNNRLNGFDFDQTNPVAGVPGVITFFGRDGLGKYSHDPYMGAWGPRIGLAYQLTTKTVIRSGYGINYYGAYRGAVPNAFSLGFSTQGSFTSPDGGFTRALTLADGMPSTDAAELGPAFGSVEVGQRPSVAPQFFRKGHRSAMVQQWNFGIQHQLPSDFLIEASYMANMGHRLGGANVNWNVIPLVGGQGPERQAQTLRRFPHFNNVSQRSADWGNSSYHSGNLKIEKRYSAGFNMLMNYTWSKYLDDVEGNSELSEFQGNRNTHPELRHLDRGYSGSDIRHRLALSAVYELPFGKNRQFAISNPVLDAIAGGWGLGIITEFRTGSPYVVIENRNESNTYSAAQRPNILGDPVQQSQWRDNVKGETFFDTSLFERPGNGAVGTAPSTFCCGPGLANIDVSVHKWFDITESVRLQFRGDFYNFPNHPQFANPEERRGRGGFGRIASTLRGTGGRVSQLSLRVEF